jgi:hypothetical protein
VIKLSLCRWIIDINRILYSLLNKQNSSVTAILALVAMGYAPLDFTLSFPVMHHVLHLFVTSCAKNP